MESDEGKDGGEEIERCGRGGERQGGEGVPLSGAH